MEGTRRPATKGKSCGEGDADEAGSSRRGLERSLASVMIMVDDGDDDDGDVVDDGDEESGAESEILAEKFSPSVVRDNVSWRWWISSIAFEDVEREVCAEHAGRESEKSEKVKVVVSVPVYPAESEGMATAAAAIAMPSNSKRGRRRCDGNILA